MLKVTDFKLNNDNIKEAIDILRSPEQAHRQVINLKKTDGHPSSAEIGNEKVFEYDFAGVKGQAIAKSGMEIAAAGNHNIILIGSPGCGKTLMAKSLPSILPPLSRKEALETSMIYSVAGLLDNQHGFMKSRPFRAPHHTATISSLIGGGSSGMPGEISLAHNGVLFLDELPEFKRTVLEVMRQPLEDRKITISRAKSSIEYPTSVMLIASMNPCPCGYYNHPTRECVCPPGMVQKYLSKISGPLLDRIDIHIEIVPVPFEELSRKEKYFI